MLCSTMTKRPAINKSIVMIHNFDFSKNSIFYNKYVIVQMNTVITTKHSLRVPSGIHIISLGGSVL